MYSAANAVQIGMHFLRIRIWPSSWTDWETFNSTLNTNIRIRLRMCMVNTKNDILLGPSFGNKKHSLEIEKFYKILKTEKQMRGKNTWEIQQTLRIKSVEVVFDHKSKVQLATKNIPPFFCSRLMSENWFRHLKIGQRDFR